MKTFTCWDIQVWDGGDRCNHKFYVASAVEANRWKQLNKFDNVDQREFEIFDSIEEYKESRSEETRQRALAKLTLVERRALGFK